MSFPTEVSKQIYQRDGWKCRIPGCGATEGLHPHHIVFASQQGPDTTANGVTVCARCHRKIHDTDGTVMIIILAKSGNPDDTPNANEGLKFKAVKKTAVPPPPPPVPAPVVKLDACQVCKGKRGGTPGNENVVNGVVMCDYCHADDMTTRGVTCDIVTSPEPTKKRGDSSVGRAVDSGASTDAPLPNPQVAGSIPVSPPQPLHTVQTAVIEPEGYEITPQTRFTVQARAMYSKDFTGTIDLGTYRELDGPTTIKSARKRAEQVLAEGYKNVTIRYFEI